MYKTSTNNSRGEGNHADLITFASAVNYSQFKC